MTELTVILLQDEVRRDLRGTKRTDTEALLIKNAGRSSTHRKPREEGKKSKKPGSSCHYCGKKDHWLRNCPDLAAELKKRRASRSEKPLVNLVDNFGSDTSDSGDDVPVPWRQEQDFPGAQCE